MPDISEGTPPVTANPQTGEVTGPDQAPAPAAPPAPLWSKPWREVERRLKEQFPGADMERVRLAYNQAQATGSPHQVVPTQNAFSDIFQRVNRAAPPMEQRSSEYMQNYSAFAGNMDEAQRIHQQYGEDPSYWPQQVRDRYNQLDDAIQGHMANSFGVQPRALPNNEPLRNHVRNAQRMSVALQRAQELEQQESSGALGMQSGPDQMVGVNTGQAWTDWVGFMGSGFRRMRAADVAQAKKSIDSGYGTNEDYWTYAQSLTQEERQQQRGFWHNLARTLVPMGQELAIGAGPASAAGEGAAALAGRLGVTNASRLGAATLGASGMTGRATGLAATAFLPAALEDQVHANVEEGRDPYSWKGIPGALWRQWASAMVFEGAGLGAGLFGAASRTGVRGGAQRFAQNAITGMAGAAAARDFNAVGDGLHSLLFTERGWGQHTYDPIVQYLRGDDQAGKELAQDAIMNVMFAGLHAPEGARQARMREQMLVERQRLDQLRILSGQGWGPGRHPEPQQIHPGIDYEGGVTPQEVVRNPSLASVYGRTGAEETSEPSPPQGDPRLANVGRFAGAGIQTEGGDEEARRLSGVGWRPPEPPEQTRPVSPPPPPPKTGTGTKLKATPKPPEPPPVKTKPRDEPAPPVTPDYSGASTHSAPTRTGEIKEHEGQKIVRQLAGDWDRDDEEYKRLNPEPSARPLTPEERLAHLTAEPTRPPFEDPAQERDEGAGKRIVAPIDQVHPSFLAAWDMISRLRPDMTNRVRSIRVEEQQGRRNAAFYPISGVLSVPAGKEIHPRTLWHELVHAEQQEKGRLVPFHERSVDEHVDMEHEAYSRASQMGDAGVWHELAALSRLRDLHHLVNERGMRLTHEQILGLSSAEQHLLAGTLEGRGVRDIAKDIGVSHGTVGNLSKALVKRFGLDESKSLVDHLTGGKEAVDPNAVDLAGSDEQTNLRKKTGATGSRDPGAKIIAYSELLEKIRGREPTAAETVLRNRLEKQLAKAGIDFTKIPAFSAKTAERSADQPPPVRSAAGNVAEPGGPSSETTTSVERTEGTGTRPTAAAAGDEAAGNKLEPSPRPSKQLLQHFTPEDLTKAEQEYVQDRRSVDDILDARPHLAKEAEPLLLRHLNQVDKFLRSRGLEEGGAAEEEIHQTALANAERFAAAERRGEGPLSPNPHEPVKPVMEAAAARLRADPGVADRLVDELSKHPRQASHEEQGILAAHLASLDAVHDRTFQEVQHLTRHGTVGDLANAQAALKDVSGKLRKAEEVVYRQGHDPAWTLAFRRQLVANDFSMRGLTRRFKSIVGRDPTPEEERKIADAAERVRTTTEAEGQAANTLSGMTPQAGETPAATNVRIGRSAEGRDYLTKLAERRKAQADIYRLADEAKDKDRSIPEKITDWVWRWIRFSILSGPKIMLKLPSAGIKRMALTPLENTLGTGIAKLPGLKGGGRREGSLPKYEWDAYKGALRGVTEGVAQRWLTGTTTLEMENQPYGSRLQGWGGVTQRPLSSWIPGKAGSAANYGALFDTPTLVHASIKEPIKAAEYSRSLLTGLEKAGNRGELASDPTVLARESGLAYLDAQRHVLMQHNGLSDWWQGQMRSLEQKGALGRVAATGLRSIVPVEKVPTNLILEGLDYAFGLATGGARYGASRFKGLQLNDAQKDVIIRSLSKGSIGAALMVAGYAGAAGGFYSGKRKEGEPEAGSFLGMPAFLSHGPAETAAQIGASIRREADRKTGPRHHQVEQGFLHAVLGTIGETVGEFPLVRGAKEAAGMTDAHEQGWWVGRYLKDMLVPQFLQFAAQHTDEADRRAPRGVGQQILSGIPGLRQQVPMPRRRSVALGRR